MLKLVPDVKGSTVPHLADTTSILTLIFIQFIVVSYQVYIVRYLATQKVSNSAAGNTNLVLVTPEDNDLFKCKALDQNKGTIFLQWLI